MKRFQVTCTGISPLLMNPASDELIEQLRTKTTARKRTDWSAQEEAAVKLYVDDDGKCGIPVENLLASLVEAGRKVPLSGRTKVSTAKTTELFSFLSIDEQFMPFPDEFQDWRVDKRRGRNPNGGEMVALVRPRFDHWSITFTVNIDDTLINDVNVKSLIEIAGRSVGLCDFRPGCRGPFGRSMVTVWEPIDDLVDVSGNGHRELAEAIS